MVEDVGRCLVGEYNDRIRKFDNSFPKGIENDLCLEVV